WVLGCTYGTSSSGNSSSPKGDSDPWISQVNSVTGCSPSGSCGQPGSMRSSGVGLATSLLRCRRAVDDQYSVSRGSAGPPDRRLPWSPMSTPLVDSLRAQDDDTLTHLLRLRPDLAVPPPADLTVLATRAGIRASVHRACDDLDTIALHVLDALVIADADTAPVAPADVRGLFGPGLPPAVL